MELLKYEFWDLSEYFIECFRNADIDEVKFEKVKSHGCLNVFGPQRFGSLYVNTADIGLLILKNEYEAAVNILLDPNNVVSRECSNLSNFIHVIFQNKWKIC